MQMPILKFFQLFFTNLLKGPFNCISKALSSCQSFSSLYFHHPALLHFICRYPELAEKFGALVLELWLAKPAQHTDAEQTVVSWQSFNFHLRLMFMSNNLYWFKWTLFQFSKFHWLISLQHSNGINYSLFFYFCLNSNKLNWILSNRWLHLIPRCRKTYRKRETREKAVQMRGRIRSGTQKLWSYWLWWRNIQLSYWPSWWVTETPVTSCDLRSSPCLSNPTLLIHSPFQMYFVVLYKWLTKDIRKSKTD